MKPRYFYLPSEVSNVTRLLAGDLLDAVARQKLTLSAWVEASNLGLIGKEQVLLGTFDYCGNIGLTAVQSKQLLCYNKKVLLESFMVLEPELITGIDDCRAQFSHLNSTQFSGVDYQLQVPEQPFLATPSVAEISDFTRGNQTAFNQMKAAQEAGDHAGAFNSFLNAFTPKETKLGYVSLTIKPDQLRFDIRDIEHAFGTDVIKANVTQQSLDDESVDDKPTVETNPIKLIAARLHKANPSFDSRKHWYALKHDVEQGAKQFDVDCLSDVMDSSAIEFFGLDVNETRRITYNRHSAANSRFKIV